ncbi:hypothetical protein [Actinoplanes friuliensis]|uniref:hypothetical protein n=1 Tax=Actinoplanes friuliensis TaxID=196914 RepID=UPI0005A1999E|nr:hypothetical protein [Actinoplanes friuliensis]
MVLYFALPPEWLAGTSYANCRYGDAVVCTFDTELAPGQAYVLSEPLPLTAPDNAAAGSWASGSPRWLTPAVWEDWQASFPGLKPGRSGTGDALDLVAESSAAAPPQVDLDDTDELADFELTVVGARRPDIAAVGARVSGTVGNRVSVRVGLVNRGPGTLYPRFFPNTSIPVTVDVPEGLDVVQLDRRCVQWSAEIAPDRYECWMGEDPLPAGGSALFGFTFAVTGDFDGEAGRVEAEPNLLYDSALESAGAGANNTAKLLVRLPDDGLPITGTGLGLGAGAFLLAGAAGVLLARRRRIRFTS